VRALARIAVAEDAPSSVEGVHFSCPICGREIKRPHKAKKLYDFRVCKRCLNRFASRRQAAMIIDFLLLLVIPSTALEEWAEAQFGAPPTASALISYLGFDWPAGFVTAWIFPLIWYAKDGFNGMSLGKWLCGVQVVDVNTRAPIGFLQSFKRNVVFLVPFSALIVLLTMMKGRRWGDTWAKTAVIWRKYAHKAPFDPRGIYCTGCGYNLTGNVTGRCPECFTPIPGWQQPVQAQQVPLSDPGTSHPA
jgi:uncharacterized RDD family membrane protein YckC/predicted RNA-binding Zn-ribbon protein involved in translation (DUF1610 family)